MYVGREKERERERENEQENEREKQNQKVRKRAQEICREKQYMYIQLCTYIKKRVQHAPIG